MTGTQEMDPHGKDPHAPGAKLDAGKLRLGLVLGSFSRALQAVGGVGTYGANKYSPNGWLQVPDGPMRYTDAMYRHLLKEHAGEALDADTQLLHAAHAAWNCLARLELMLREEPPAQASVWETPISCFGSHGSTPDCQACPLRGDCLRVAGR